MSAESHEEQLNLVFAALADPTRRALLERLSDSPAAIGTLAEPFAISLPAVSKHIRVLERAGLVRREVEGRVHRCHLDAAAMKEATSWLTARKHFWDHSLDNLARFVEDTETS